jgi:hypothetical protein
MNSDLVVVGPSGAVAILSEAAGRWRRSELTASGTWPAWNPVSDLVAVSNVETEGDAPVSTITVLSLSGAPERTVYRTPEGVPSVIAARLPHYLQWSPSGRWLSYVAQGPMGLTLHIADLSSFEADSEGGAPIINGAPIFHTWCPDDNFVGVHSGKEMSVIESDGSRATALVSDKGIGFRAPAFDDDAEHMYFAVPSTGGVSLMRALFQGTEAKAIAEFPAGVVLMPRPGSTDISVAVAALPETGAFDRLLILTRDGEQRSSIECPFVAAFWSPQGDQLALFVPMFTGDGRHAVQIRDSEGRLVSATEPFLISPDLQIMLGFFDQFSHSHSIWSRDGTEVVIAGRPAGDSIPATLGARAETLAMRFKVSEPAPLELLEPASLAFYRPRQIAVV